MVGLVHTPRVLASIAKGFLMRHSSILSPLETANSKVVGIGDNFHSYYARAGLFDVDYLGHLNNAAYLSHAEYARWELNAYNGVMSKMIQTGTNFVIASVAVRYRREIRPLFRKFQIDTSLVAIDNRSFWMLQNFRYPIPQRNRVRAQVLVQGVAIQQTGNQQNKVDPRVFLKDACGFDANLVDSITLPLVSTQQQQQHPTASEMLERYAALQESLRDAAAVDDKTHEGL